MQAKWPVPSFARNRPFRLSTVLAELILDNLLCATHVLHAAQRFGAKKLLYLASSCVDPKGAPQLIREDCMYTGPLEPTNLVYAVANLAGLEWCRTRREFLYVDDVAAAVSLMRGHSWEDPLNIGSGVAVSIAELGKMLQDITG
jgi:nucleoside-diphosphate-sugar epimerase